MSELFLSPVFWLAAAAVLLVPWLLLRRHATPGGESGQGDSINMSEFVVGGPPEGPPSLEFYGTPVRLQLIVLAPMGRRNQLPANEELPHILNHFLSGFTHLSGLHRPVLFRWPEQLSAQGFYQAFFNQLSLPDHGRGSCWSAVAGRFTVSEAQYLVGMAFTAEKANGMGEVTVQHEGQWFDVLRIKELPE